MSTDLTSSDIARRNILNNRYALEQLETALKLGGLRIDGELIFFKSHVAELLAIDERTIDRYLANFELELKGNGYRLLKGKSLKNIKLAQVDDINVVDLIGAKTPSLGVFTFRAVLNLAMLVTESERAKAIRSRLLDIALDGAYFLTLNGYDYCVPQFVIQMENIVVAVAEGKINKQLLRRLLISLIQDDDFSEDFKLELLASLEN